MDKTLPKDILSVVSDVQKIFGQGEVFLPKFKPLNINRVPLGLPSVDRIIGGGIPRGRMIEIFGPESSGKTTLALQIVKAFQQAGLGTWYIDAEHALDTKYARDLGVDIDNMPVSQPQVGEDALNLTEFIINSDKIKLIVIDTVASLLPRAELDGNIGDAHMALLANLMTATLRKITPISKAKDCTILFLNQTRFKVGMFFGSPEYQPGGTALKFWSSIRLDIRKKENVNGGSQNSPDFTGVRSLIKYVKNKTAPPFKTTMITIIFGKGIDQITDLANAMFDSEFIYRKGSNYYLSDTFKIGNGKNNTIEYIKSHYDKLLVLYKTALANPDNKDKLIEAYVGGKTADAKK